MKIYAADCRDIAPRRDEALALLPPERRARVLAQAVPDAALRSLCAGLLLRRFAGPGPFDVGPYGKPSLPGGPCFSLAHSGDLALLAVDECAVGVDTERCGRPWADETARRVLTDKEQRWLARGERSRFLWLWTRKEAVMKVCGLGLALPAASFSVLESRTQPPDQSTYYLKTIDYVNYFISVASVRPPEVRLVPVGPDTLMEQEVSYGDQD